MSLDREITSNPLFLPHRLDPERGAIGFLELTREEISSTPFLRKELIGENRPEREILLADLDSSAIPSSPPANFIFHSAFCCSTLLSRSLDIEGKNLSLKEPEILMDLANLKRMGGPVVKSRADWVKLLSLGLDLLGRPQAQGERILIKPTNAANNLIGDVLAADEGTKILLLYSNLRNFLISILKKGEEGRGFGRRLFFIFLHDSPFVKDWPIETVARMTDLQLAAVVWRMQMNAFMDALSAVPKDRVRTLDSDELLAGPETMLGRIDDYFGLGIGSRAISEIVAGPLFKQHAKFDGQEYDSTAKDEEKRRIEADHGEELSRIIEWERRLDPDRPIPQPLPNAI